MNIFLDESPIIACSTGTTSNAAIAVIRLSGFIDLSTLAKFFSIDIKQIKPRYAHLTNLLDSSLVVDNILITFFPKKQSYNGENILELSVHGNLLNISRIIELFTKGSDFRLALPGEFSYRALKNKKLSLSQVEGLDLLLNANSTLMLEQGLEIMQGELHQQYLKLHEALMKLKSAVELSIDFADDIGDDQAELLFKNSLLNFKTILTSLYQRTRGDTSSLLSPSIVICGETNAGKSSLFNILLKHNRSIVSSIPGTTRDYVSELIFFNGTNFKLLDTAGIRDSQDIIEQEGIDRAFEMIKTSFFKILVIDPTSYNLNYLHRFDSLEFDLLIFSHADSEDFLSSLSSVDFSFIRSKFCLSASFYDGSIGPVISASTKIGPIEPLNDSGPIEPVLKGLISNKYNKLTESGPILIDRHKFIIKKLYNRFLECETNISNINDIAIISSEINTLDVYSTELLGVFSADDVLNSIFSNFCIGK